MTESRRHAPVNTYRIQLTPQFGFAAAAAIVPYLHELGVTHLYCSPWLQAAPGSQHGYDVVDHSRLNAELGSAEDHARLIETLHEHGMGVVLDIVPNHMAVSEPESQNAQWWELLRSGPGGRAAAWFDVDWEAQDGRVLVPVLGSPLAEAMDELTRKDGELRYYDHVVPDSEFVRLADWHVGNEELNYRRFFDVTTLAGIRVENGEVFDASHALILEQVRSGAVDALRVDHPDGLAEPGAYLQRLAEHSGGVWTAVEKILEPGEQLPATWRTVGTTGYDALNMVLGLLTSSAAEKQLTALYAELTGEQESFEDVVERSKRLIVERVLAAEVARLARGIRAALPEEQDVTESAVKAAIVELLVGFEVYRAYITPGESPDLVAAEHLAGAAGRARARRPDLVRQIDLILDVVKNGPSDVVRRFQQTCGPVMAKGVEDTAFYRYFRLSGLNEVGGNPGRIGLPISDFHAWCERMQRDWPNTMTTLSTHDTKRSEDVRARLMLLSHNPAGWAELARAGMHRLAALAPEVDANTRYLALQSLVGAWPIDAERLGAYLEKATREAKQSTSWTERNADYDQAVQRMARAALADAELTSLVKGWVDEHNLAAVLLGRSQKLIQLTIPGVADCYQGTETESLSLVDPDNRRPVDYAGLAESLRTGSDPKQRLTTTVLRLRRAHPDWFVGPTATYERLDAGRSAVAFVRSDRVLTVAPIEPRLKEASITLPPGLWRECLSGKEFSGTTALADLLAGPLGVALLVRTED